MSEAKLRSLVLFASAAAMLGIATALFGDSTMGGLMTVGGVLVLIASVHRFGRLGEPDAWTQPQGTEQPEATDE